MRYKVSIPNINREVESILNTEEEAHALAQRVRTDLLLTGLTVDEIAGYVLVTPVMSVEEHMDTYNSTHRTGYAARRHNYLLMQYWDEKNNKWSLWANQEFKDVDEDNPNWVSEEEAWEYLQIHIEQNRTKLMRVWRIRRGERELISIVRAGKSYPAAW